MTLLSVLLPVALTAFAPSVPVAAPHGCAITPCDDGTTSCIPSETYCHPDRCVDTTSDDSHCGSCGSACTDGRSCSSSTCIDPAGTVFFSRMETSAFLDDYSHATTSTTGVTWTAANGGHVAAVNGGNNGLIYAGSNDFLLGTGAFTIEFDVRFTSVAGGQQLFCQHVSGSYVDFIVELNGAGRVRFYDNDCSYIVTDTAAMTTGVTYHIAVTRSGNTFTLYRDGTARSSGTCAASVGSATTALGVGGTSNHGGSSALVGWIDNARVNKGNALTCTTVPCS